jgi:hypothetical protein
MSRKILLLLAIFVSASAFVPVAAQEQAAVIRIVQDQSMFLGDFQTTIKLKRKPFRFQIMLQHCDGVYVFASIRDSVYRFTETSVIQDFSYLKLLELRDEDVFNTNRELNISETGWSYWFYSPTAEWYPFNRKVVYVDTDKAVCTKYIKQLYDVGERNTIKLRDIDKPVYLFFLAVKDYDANGKPLHELMRRKVKIEWEGDDDD